MRDFHQRRSNRNIKNHVGAHSIAVVNERKIILKNTQRSSGGLPERERKFGKTPGDDESHTKETRAQLKETSVSEEGGPSAFRSTRKITERT